MWVTVYSHFRQETWRGEVPDQLLVGKDVNEELFRLFNRVDEADVGRLEAWGYTLPSLSVGDRLLYGGRMFTVEDVGFKEVGVRDMPA